MFLKYFLFFLLFLGFCITKAQDVKVSGKITIKQTQKPLENALVLLKNEQKILSYTYTNKNGVYHLKLISAEATKYNLEISSLGHAKKQYNFSLQPNKKSYTFDFSLAENEETLSTVVLKSDKKIKINRDTISYKASSFTNGSERSVEDLLGKIPGIEITDTGEIKALGKKIEKILIEGDDLAGNRYKVISKNLGSDVIDKVDIVSNYDENPILKQFLNSENVVLNLRLKKNKKSVLFGNIKAGGGIENRFLADADIGLITPGLKFLNLAESNNVGNVVNNQFKNYTYSAQGFNDFNKNFSIRQNPVIYLDSGNLIFLPDNTYIENTSLANNLLLNERLGENGKIRNSLFFYTEKFENDNSVFYKYFVEPEDITYTEQNSIQTKNLNLSNDFTISYAISKNLYIESNNTLTLHNKKQENHLKFNGSDDIFQNLQRQERELESKTQITRKTDYGAAVFDIFLGSKKGEEFFLILPNQLGQQEQSTKLYTNYDTSIDYQGLDGAFIFKNNKTTYSLTGGFKHFNEVLNTKSTTNFDDNTIDIDSLSGNNFANHLESHAQFKLETEVVKNLFFSSEIDAKLNYYTKNNFSNTFFLPNPQIKINFKKTKTGSYLFRYSYETEIPRLNYFTDNYMVNSYRNLKLGIKEVKALKSHNYLFSYTLSKVEQRLHFNASISYILYKNGLSFYNRLSETTDTSKLTYTSGKKTLAPQARITTYINPLYTTLKLGYQLRISEKPVQLNDNFTILNSQTSSYSLNATTFWKGIVNFKLLANYSINQAKSKNTSVRNKRYRFKLDSSFKIYDAYFVNIESNAFVVASDFYETNSLNMEYRPKDKDWSLGLQIQNIFNTKEYLLENAFEYSQSIQSYRAIKRYAFIYGSFRF